MKPDYKNWVPKGMLAGFAAGLTAALAAYGLWLVLDWYELAVMDELLDHFDKF